MRDGGPRAPLDLDAVEARALAAWLDADAGLELEDDGTALPGGVLPGFAERVMEAESSVVQIPALVAIDVDPTPEASPVAPRGNRRWGLGVAAAFVAGLSSLWVASQPGPATSTTEIVATPAADATSDAARPAGLPIPDDLDARIADYIADYGRHFGPTFEFHGTILVARDGKIHYQHGFGVADPRRGVENAPATRMRIGMLTEQFTATAILQLRDAGMLQLSDPIEEHLPGFPNGRRITIENLLDHTSGIPNYTDVPTFHRWKALPHRTEEMIGRFSELPLEFQPGSDFNPTNSGYYLLGAIIERCSGMSYGEYMQRYVFEPAGMTRTGYGEDNDVARGNVWNEEEQLDPPDPIDMSVFGGAGGLVSTVEDFAKWDRALYGTDVLPTSSIEQMFDANRFGYGFGWLVGEAYDQPVVSFPGAIDGFNSAVMRFLEDRTLVVVLANTEVVPAGRIAQDIAMMIYGEQPAPRIEFPEVEVAPGTFTRYVGTYGITDETIRVLGDPTAEAQFEPLQNVSVNRIGDRLYFDVPGHGSTWMHPMGRHRFFFKDNSGNYVTFTTGEDGVANGLVVQVGDAELELARKGD
ncbi:MAG: beta-lactamase family protein [Myxococcales bacterium]|nr:beta-lactamase family protein [Myxococcales bacterium]